MICYYCNSLKVLHVTEQMGFFHYLKKKMAFFRIFLLFGLENQFGKKREVDVRQAISHTKKMNWISAQNEHIELHTTRTHTFDLACE